MAQSELCSFFSCIGVDRLIKPIVLLSAIAAGSAGAVTLSDSWIPVATDPSLSDPESLEIEPNSILDFSTIKANPAITSENRRLVVNSKGHFSYKNAPSKNLKFLIASPSFDIRSGGFPTKAALSQHVKQYKMHGYNMVRFHFIEYLLMYKQQNDFGFLTNYVAGDDSQLDRFFYYVSELKNNGIYLLVDGLSAPNGGYGDTSLNGYYWDRYIDQKKLKFGVYFDPVAQQHWKDLVQAIYGTVNPYTQKTLLQDPVLSGVVLVNENNLISMLRGNEAVIDARFNDWLLNKYGSQNALQTAWGNALPATENVEQGTVTVARWSAGSSKKLADSQRFFLEVQKLTSDWMTSYLRDLGYIGSVTSYNFFETRTEQLNRNQFAWTDMHHYFSQEYYDGDKLAIGQDSMLGKSAWYIQVLASARNIGKPYTISEHGHLAWNRYRYESSLALPAYSALQSWSAICQHANSIALSYKPPVNGFRTLVEPYAVSYDPISRVTETAAALLYLRGDVAAAKNVIGAKLDAASAIENSSWQDGTPTDVSRLSLVTGLGLDVDGEMLNRVTSGTSIAKYDAYVSTTEPGKLTMIDGSTYSSTPADMSSTSLWQARIANLKDAGVLAVDNKTSSDGTIFHSDTKQLLLDKASKTMMVKTSRSEAYAFESLDTPVKINQLTLESATTSGMVLISSMDVDQSNKISPTSIVASKRMLIAIATDAQNTGMDFTNETGTTLINYGQRPVRIKPTIIHASLKNNNSLALKLYAVNLRGKRMQEIPVTRTNCNATDLAAATACGGLDLVIDTSQLTQGSTTYFELATN